MQTILVALDFSPAGAHVIATATDLARKAGGQMLLAHIIGIPVGLPPEAYSMSPENVVDLLLQNARRELDRIVGEIPKELVKGVVVEVGTPWRALCDIARDRSVDLVVIGAHGYRFVDRVLGTTTGRVVSHLECSVLVVRPSMAHPSAAPQ